MASPSGSVDLVHWNSTVVPVIVALFAGETSVGTDGPASVENWAEKAAVSGFPARSLTPAVIETVKSTPLARGAEGVKVAVLVVGL